MQGIGAYSCATRPPDGGFMRLHSSGLGTRCSRVVALTLVLSAAVVATACSSDSGSVPSLRATAPVSVPGKVELDGIVVSVQTTDAAGFSSSEGLGRIGTVPAAPPGVSRITIHAQAVNSTESTIPVRIRLNTPKLRDSIGDYLEPVGVSSRATGTDVGRGMPQVLGPGGTFETLQAFDLPPAVGELEYVWELEAGKVARFAIR